MPSLKEISGKSGNKKTQKNNAIRHLSLLFIKSEKRPYYVIMNKTDWEYLKSLPGITEYLDIQTNKELLKNEMVGTIWSAPILIVDETDEIKVYHENNVNDMKKDFPKNRTILSWSL